MLDMLVGAALAVLCIKFNRRMTKPTTADETRSWESVRGMMEDFS